MPETIKAVEPITAIPFAGSPCFLNPELAQFKAEMEDGIFSDQQQVADWLAEQGLKNTPILLPGDSWDVTTCTKDPDPIWKDFSFAKRNSYLESYAERRSPRIEKVKTRYPETTDSLWEPFRDYLERLLEMSPYFNQKIGMRVGFDLVGPGGGQWAVDFHALGKLLSLHFHAWRNPDIYSDHLLGLLKFSLSEALKAVEDYETSMDLTERITIHTEGQDYLVQRYCPHAGQDLLETGEVLPGGILRCLAHHYEFNLETGQCLNGNCASLDSKHI